MEVHGALRRAGRARGEGDDRDVVGGGVDRLERPARGQVLEQQRSARRRRPRRPARGWLSATRGLGPSRPPCRSRAPAAAASSRRRSRPRAGSRARRRSRPAVLGECSSTRVAGLDREHATPPPTRARAAPRRTTRRRSRRRPCAAARPPRSAAPGSRAAAGPARPPAAGSRSRANVSISAAPPARSPVAGPRTPPRRSAARGSRGTAARPPTRSARRAPPKSWTASSITRCAVSVACSLAIAASRVTRCGAGVLRPRGAVDEQRARVDARAPCRASLACTSGSSAIGAPNSVALLHAAERLVERPPREPERGRADGRAEHVQRARARSASPSPAGRSGAPGASSKRSVASGCGAITSMRSTTSTSDASTT